MAKRSSWKNERASVSRGGKRARSNKYSRNDETERPARGSRQRVWVGGYRRDDGTRVRGHFRVLSRGGTNRR